MKRHLLRKFHRILRKVAIKQAFIRTNPLAKQRISYKIHKTKNKIITLCTFFKKTSN